MSRVAIIGAGPCGLSMLRSFYQSEKKGEKIPEVVCFGELDLINMVIQCLIACIDIFGQMDQKNV